MLNMNGFGVLLRWTICVGVVFQCILVKRSFSNTAWRILLLQQIFRLSSSITDDTII